MNKKLGVMVVGALLISSLSLAGCSSKSASNTTSGVKVNDTLHKALPATILSSGKITVGTDDSYPPMEYRDASNSLVGFDIDLGNAISQKLGVKIEWVPTAWDGIIPGLLSKKYDLIMSSMSITEERKKQVNFSQPYIQGGPIIITQKANTSIKGGTDLAGKTVGVQLGTTGDDAATAIKEIKEVKRYNKITDALQDLAVGRIDAVVADDQVGRYYVGLSPDKFVTAAKLNDEPFGIALRKEDSALTEAVQKAYDELKAEGVLSQLSMKWFKVDVYK